MASEEGSASSAWLLPLLLLEEAAPGLDPGSGSFGDEPLLLLLLDPLLPPEGGRQLLEIADL